MVVIFLEFWFWKFRGKTCLFLDTRKSEHKYCCEISFTLMKSNVLGGCIFHVFHGQNPPLSQIPGARGKGKVQLVLCKGCRTEPSLTKCITKKLFCLYVQSGSVLQSTNCYSLLVTWQEGLSMAKEWLALHSSWTSMLSKQLINVHIWILAM